MKGKYGRESQDSDQKEISTEKIHTPTSLFGKLRLKLHDLKLIRKIDSVESLEELQTGHFVEFKAILRRNPLVNAVEGLVGILNMVASWTETESKLHKGSQPKKKGKSQIRLKLLQNN